MRCKVVTFCLTVILCVPAQAADNVHLSIDASKPGPKIDRNIFGQFAENLGHGLYEGIWVGPDSFIASTRGIRNDAVAALRDLKIPNVRWPGGCFADQYHWRKGVGPQNKRAATVNSARGDVIDTNAFGTDEFMDFIHQIGSTPYVSINIGSGTPQEAAEWLEYMTAAAPTALAKEAMSEDRKTLTIAVLNPSDSEQRIRIAISGTKLASAEACGEWLPSRSMQPSPSVRNPEVQIEEQTLGALPDTIAVRPFSVSIYSYPMQ